MKVYVLQLCENYEGCRILGVYSTIKLAEEQRELRKKISSVEYYEIEDVEVDEKRNDSNFLDI